MQHMKDEGCSTGARTQKSDACSHSLELALLRGGACVPLLGRSAHALARTWMPPQWMWESFALCLTTLGVKQLRTQMQAVPRTCANAQCLTLTLTKLIPKPLP